MQAGRSGLRRGEVAGLILGDLVKDGVPLALLHGG
jgi:hypothetical protein